jgi:nucleotide-binding universal stress UspA family protein
MKTKTLTRISGTKGNRLLVAPAAIKPAPRPQAAAVSGPNLKVKNIVVPIDFSAESQKALQYASKLASQFGATLKLIHVVEPTPFINDLPNVVLTRSDQEIAKESRIRLQALAKDEIDELIPVQTGVRIGKPYHEIASFAKVTDADLIVISTHGYTGLKHTLLGSTAERVVRYATCPVLVVRDARKERL